MGLARMMSLAELSEMLGVPLNTVYGWRYRGEGPVGYRVGKHCGFVAAMWRRSWRRARTSRSVCADHGVD